MEYNYVCRNNNTDNLFLSLPSISVQLELNTTNNDPWAIPCLARNAQPRQHSTGPQSLTNPEIP